MGSWGIATLKSRANTSPTEDCDDHWRASGSRAVRSGRRGRLIERRKRLRTSNLPGWGVAENFGAPASHNANLDPVVEGPAISLAARHVKVRREGYRQ